ncbi:IPT/TIG domain-containing protein [Geobacter sp. AOG1]|uniref:beta strand repeat-containing protein n=1 Tax=Geobacter sp. AOG1 TaxID=1566346 RepID=UPI001CC69FDF|nr:IPT/TIG domain-containing protein [Geobacter sp. AOG1]
MAKKIRGMNLWVKVGLVVMATLLATIVMYQEKPVKAASGDVILLWDTANGAVPAGWTSISSVAGDAFYGVFPRAAASYGAATAGSDTHTHTMTFSSAGAGATGTYAPGGTAAAAVAHTHTWPSPTVTTVDHKPPFKNLVFIKASNPTQIPANAIAIFDTTTLPAGWTQYAALNGNYLRGFSDNATGGAATHNHDTGAVTTSAVSGTVSTNAGATNRASATHTHTLAAQTAAFTADNNAPPYVQVVFAYNSSGASTPIPVGLIAMFDTTPTGGWTVISNAAPYTNNLLLGTATTPGTTGGSATFNHGGTEVYATSGAATGNYASATGTAGGSASAHTHANVTYTVSSVSSYPVYRDVILAKRTVTPPTISTPLNPSSGNQGTTLNVVITGTNFQSGATASFSGSGITVNSTTFNTSTQLTVNISIGPAATTGAGNVTVTNPDGGNAISTGAFTVNAAPTPTVTSTSPNSMTQGAGPTTVTITGTNFLNGATVAFSGTGITLGAVTYVNATTLTVPVTVAAGATTGARNVTVTLPGGQTGTGTGVFTVNAPAPPTVTSTSPNTMSQGTGPTTVTITGTNFTGATAVSFNDANIALGAFTVVNATTITVPVTVLPATTTGAKNVSVTTPGGTATGTGVFTVTAGTCTANAPTVTLSANANVQPGQQAVYTLSVTNNDSAFCGSTTFTIAIGTETGNTASFVLPSVLGSATTGALAPGATYNTTLTVKAQAAAVGGNNLTSTVNVSGSGHTTQSDSATTFIATAWANNALLHNSTNATNSSKSASYWSANGGWGIPGAKYGAFDCTTCHIPGSSNISRIRVTLTPPDATTFPGSAVLFQSKTTINDGTNPSFGVYSAAITSSTKICEVCHSQTNYHRQNMSAAVSHENKAQQVDCIVCHPHDQGFKAIGGCTVCHKFVQRNKRAPVMGFFSSGNSHHIQGAGVADQNCYQCHWEANSDGTVNVNYHDMRISGAPVNLAVYQSGARPVVRNTTTFVPYSATGTRHDMQKLNAVCLGCHSAASATAQPFGDGKTPQQYAWDGKSIDERYSQTAGVKWGKYSSSGTNAHNVNAKDTVIKAFSAHGNSALNKRGWDTTNGTDGPITNTGGSVNVLCYDCHNSHGSTVKGITSNYSSATGRNHGALLKDTDNGIGGYTANYQPSSDSTTANAKYNPGAGLCFDCHLNSTAGATLPWGYSGTFGASQRIMGYWDSPYFKTPTVAGDYFGPAQRFAYKATVVANKGGHFGASSVLDNPPDAQHQINGLCTPCHDPHGVSPTLNQAYSVPLLKGTWMTSPYKEDATPVNTNESRGGTNHGGSNTTRPNQQNVSSTPRYHIDQNTFGGSTTANEVNFGTAQTATKWNLADTTNRIKETDTQFGGLCLNCHSKTLLAPKAGQNVAPDAWKSRSRIHGTVKGWATTSTAADGNANNKVHSYTCSKCHAPHNYRLPRLMAVNCLNFEHRGQKGTTGIVGVATVAGVVSSTGYASPTDDGFHEVTTGQCGKGRGRFPIGGGYYSPLPPSNPRQSAQNPGQWWWGNTSTGAFNSCHDNANTIDTTYPMKQRWNSKTPW